MEPTKEEKKRLQALEIEKMKQLNSIMRIRANDPRGLGKVDPNKVWCYETIENVAYVEVNEFDKQPKKTYALKDSNFNKLDFPFNHSMFTFNQFKFSENFHDTKEYKSMKM